jgi:hypothetical protein
MKVCVYDSPVTMAREMWKDGKLDASITLELMSSVGFRGHRVMRFPLNCGPWETGRVLGDPEAMTPS